jgi:hypothetical protein
VERERMWMKAIMAALKCTTEILNGVAEKNNELQVYGLWLEPTSSKNIAAPPPPDCDVAAASMLVITAALLDNEVSLGT